MFKSVFCTTSYIGVKSGPVWFENFQNQRTGRANYLKKNQIQRAVDSRYFKEALGFMKELTNTPWF
jgi:hypothetical protein